MTTDFSLIQELINKKYNSNHSLKIIKKYATRNDPEVIKQAEINQKQREQVKNIKESVVSEAPQVVIGLMRKATWYNDNDLTLFTMEPNTHRIRDKRDGSSIMEQKLNIYFAGTLNILDYDFIKWAESVMKLISLTNKRNIDLIEEALLTKDDEYISEINNSLDSVRDNVLDASDLISIYGDKITNRYFKEYIKADEEYNKQSSEKNKDEELKKLFTKSLITLKLGYAKMNDDIYKNIEKRYSSILRFLLTERFQSDEYKPGFINYYSLAESTDQISMDSIGPKMIKFLNLIPKITYKKKFTEGTDTTLEGLYPYATLFAQAYRKQINKYLNKYGNYIDENLKELISGNRESFRNRVNTYLGENILRDNPLELPYTNYTGNFDGMKEKTGTDNCLINYICYIHGSRRAISTIKNFFRNGTSLDNIKDYCIHYESFDCHIMDVFGRTIYSRKCHSKKRDNPISGILYNKHFYYKNKGTSFKPELIEGNEVLSYTNKLEESSIFEDNLFVERFNKRIMPNYTHCCEREISMLPLKYCDANYLDNNPDDTLTYDMNAAYYNTLLHSENKPEIPIFGVLDKWEKYTGQNITDNSYVAISKGFLKRCKYIGITSNIMHYYTYKIARLIVDKGDESNNYIDHFKVPSYSADPAHFVKILEELAAEHKPSVRPGDHFRLCNGLMGQIIDKFNPIECLIPDTDKDYELLLKDICDKYNQYYMIVDRDGKRYFRLSGEHGVNIQSYNSLSFYYWIVDMTNATILGKILYLRSKYKRNFKIYKIITDSITFNKKYGEAFKEDFIGDQYAQIPDKYTKYNVSSINWKIEDKKIKVYNTNQFYHNINDLFDYDDFSHNIVIVSGEPGTGKTHFAKKQKYDIAAAFTNMCCRNMDTDRVKAITLHRLFRFKNTCKMLNKDLVELRSLKNKIVWIDEYSMIPPLMFNLIAYCIIKYKTKFLLTGDTYQLPPIGYESYYDTHKIKLLTNDKERLLTKNYRFAADEHGNLPFFVKSMKNIIDGKWKDFRIYMHAIKKVHRFEKNSECIEKFTPNIEFTEQELEFMKYINSLMYRDKGLDSILAASDHICYTNRYKNELNKAIMFYKNKRFDEKEISTGIKLISLEKFKIKDKVIYKNDLVFIIKSDDKGVTIKLFRNSNEICIDRNTILSKFNVGYARTIHSVQGQTIHDKLFIHEIFKHSAKMLYTAFTRVTKEEDILLVSDLLFTKRIERYNRDTIGLVVNTKKIEEEDVIKPTVNDKKEIISYKNVYLWNLVFIKESELYLHPEDHERLEDDFYIGDLANSYRNVRNLKDLYDENGKITKEKIIEENLVKGITYKRNCSKDEDFHIDKKYLRDDFTRIRSYLEFDYNTDDDSDDDIEEYDDDKFDEEIEETEYVTVHKTINEYKTHKKRAEFEKEIESNDDFKIVSSVNDNNEYVDPYLEFLNNNMKPYISDSEDEAPITQQYISPIMCDELDDVDELVI